MGDPQRLDDTEQPEILALLEAASTEPSAMRAARALAEVPAGWWRSPGGHMPSAPPRAEGRFLTAGRVLRLPLG